MRRATRALLPVKQPYLLRYQVRPGYSLPCLGYCSWLPETLYKVVKNET